MKVALDISSTQSGHKVRGIGFYTQRLHRHLARLIAEEKDFTLIPYTQGIPKADLIHIPAFSPFVPSLPVKNIRKTIVTVHDLIPLEYPEHFPAGIKGTLIWSVQKRLLQMVKHIITDSKASQTSIEKLVGISKEKISVIYLAADETFMPVVQKNKLTAVKEKYMLPEDFILYVGDMNWNKNVVMLAKTALKKKVHLVVVGKQAIADIDPMHPWNAELASFQMETKQHPELIHCLGFVDTPDLPAIYSLARVLVHPAKAEGFGLPVLEAMQCGCPVITSKTSSLGEIAGENAVLIDPYKPAELEEALFKVWNDDDLREDLSEKGIVYSKKYSWDKTARETLEVYRKCLIS